MKLNCLIVDDEPPAHLVLQRYIEKIERLQLLGQCYNALEALNFLHQHQVDVVFLDIDMPELSGLELLRSLQRHPAIILTTAYTEFALESYEYGVADYLLKPIRFERFLKAVNRVVPAIGLTTKSEGLPVNQSSAPAYLMVKVGPTIQKIDTAEIVYLSAVGNYVQLHFSNRRPILSAATMGDMQKQLAPFIRVHKSYLINVDFLEKIEGNRLWLKGAVKIPIGGSYKQAVLGRLG